MGMFASTLTGKYCSQHHLLWLESLQEWLSFSEKRLLHTFGDSMCIKKSACPRCLNSSKEIMRRMRVLGPLISDLQTDSQSAVAPGWDADTGSRSAPGYPPAGRQRSAADDYG